MTLMLPADALQTQPVEETWPSGIVSAEPALPRVPGALLDFNANDIDLDDTLSAQRERLVRWASAMLSTGALRERIKTVIMAGDNKQLIEVFRMLSTLVLAGTAPRDLPSAPPSVSVHLHMSRPGGGQPAIEISATRAID